MHFVLLRRECENGMITKWAPIQELDTTSYNEAIKQLHKFASDKQNKMAPTPCMVSYPAPHSVIFYINAAQETHYCIEPVF